MMQLDESLEVDRKGLVISVSGPIFFFFFFWLLKFLLWEAS